MRPLLALLALLAFALPAVAQDRLTGTLLKIRQSGKVVIGYRESALPLSYVTAGGTPIGYSIDLCREIVDDIVTALAGRQVAIDFHPVTSENRIELVRNGTVDLECGSTTASLERKKLVAFSPTIFVSGTKLLVPAASKALGLRDLAGQPIAVTAGTTNAAAIQALDGKQKLGLKLMASPDNVQSFALVQGATAAAFASDDVLLYGLIVAAKDPAAWKVVGDFLSFEPYGIVFRRDDPDFAQLVADSFTRMAEEGRLTQLYTRWFMRRLPTGQRLSLPMSPQLEEIFRALGEED